MGEIQNAIQQQFSNVNEEIDKDIASFQGEQKLIDETKILIENADSTLIDSFMEGLIEFIETKERQKHK